MANSTIRQQKLELIADRRAEAEQLLSTARHESVKARIRNVIRDLDEAVLWLKDDDVDERPLVLGIVNTRIAAADAVLEYVDAQIKERGSDFRFIG